MPVDAVRDTGHRIRESVLHFLNIVAFSDTVGRDSAVGIATR